jgi:hypothetical protein
MKKTLMLWLGPVLLLLFTVVGIGTTSLASTSVPEQKSEKVVFPLPVTEVVTITPTMALLTPTPSVHPSPVFTSTVAEATPTETASPTPPYELCQEGSKEICFGDYYNILPGDTYVHTVIVPDTIVIHTNDAPGNTPKLWFGANTWYGLEGRKVSVHFGVGLDGVSQFLSMYESGVTQCRGGQYRYNLHSIQIEMSGRDYDNFITGQASPDMATSVVTITDKTINLVITLMKFYNIPFENVMGHYQMEGSGKTDPGNSYFEQYFLPLLKSKLSQQNSR